MQYLHILDSLYWKACVVICMYNQNCTWIRSDNPGCVCVVYSAGRRGKDA